MTLQTVTSKDGTPITFERSGEGPTIILVGGAIQYRAIDPQTTQLAAFLAQDFTVFHYDRRGRGDSGDTLPYAVEREIDDLEALIDEAGGSAFVFGMSSGAALALQAAIRLGYKIKKLALYEAPYNSETSARHAYQEYTKQLQEVLAAGRRGDAVALFLKLAGMPAGQIEGMRHAEMWPMFEAVAPTLAYDAAVMGQDASVPTELASRVAVPTLVMDGGASDAFMHNTATSLAKAIPQAQHRTLAGQAHNVDMDVLAPVLAEFFAA
ncbi:MAG: alpha/beta hydrolase [Anaerolineales bacterium]